MALFGSADAAERWMANGYTPPAPPKRPLGQRRSSSPTISGGSRTIGTGAPSAPAAQKAYGLAQMYAAQAAAARTQYATTGEMPRTIGSVQLPQNTVYPTTPAPLSAAFLAQMADLRVGANQDYATALAEQKRGEEKVSEHLYSVLGNLARQFQGARTSATSELGAAGLALSPASAVTTANALRNRQADQFSQARRTAADGRLDLKMRVDLAEARRRAALQSIERHKAAAGADLNQLLPGVRY